MNWLWLIIGAIVLFFLLKIVMKTLKIVFILVLISTLVAVFWFWQHGVLFK